MPTVLLIVGIVVVILGIIIFIWPKPPPPPEPYAAGPIGEIGEVLGKLIELLEKFDKRARPGLLLIFVGLTLIGIGAWLESHDAKNAAEGATVLFLTPGLLRLRRL